MGMAFKGCIGFRKPMHGWNGDRTEFLLDPLWIEDESLHFRQLYLDLSLIILCS